MSSLEIRSKEQNYMTKNVEHKEAWSVLCEVKQKEE
jgi:hypothetical protein